MGHGTTAARSDDALIAASQRGDRDAFGQLVERYLDVVCAVGYSQTGSRALSEDVAQDTFLAAWSQLGTLREPPRLRAWLCGIARNLARKARARAAREPATDRVAEEPATGPLERLTAAEEQRLVWDALAQVPAAYREVLVLYYQQERSLAEVAAQLGIREDAAMQRLSRGRKHLAGQLHATVERALDGARPSRDVSRKIMAALPLMPLPSSTGSLSSTSTTGHLMLKLALFSALGVAAAGATVTYVATRDSSAATVASSSYSAAELTAAAPGRATPTRAIAPHARQAAPAGEACANEIDDDVPALDADAIAAHRLHEGPSRGPADAPVQIAVFQDVECHYCAMVLGTIDQLWEEYPGKLRLIVHQFPLPNHANAQLGAEASLAAEAQGKFWPFHDLVIANQDALSRDAFIELAGEAGLDVPAFTAALDHHTYADAVARDLADGADVGVQGTPSFYINGQQFTGAQPVEAFRAAIDAALAE